MPNIPVRALGQLGLNTDVSPYDLPLNAWSSAVNVRFSNDRVRRSPIFREVFDVSGSTNEPRHIAAQYVEGAADEVLMLDASGNSWSISGSGAITDFNHLGFVPIAGNKGFTTCSLGQVKYWNRGETHVPHFLLPGGSEFNELTNWDATHRCESLRPFKDFLVALNITKGATASPYLVKWSDGALLGQVPPSWDHTDPLTNAGENPLTDLTGGIVDGGAMGDRFAIYTSREVVMMDFIGGDFIFSFRTRWRSNGIISKNCYVEDDGKHYVFGSHDIYVHDGMSRKSLAEGRITKWLYKDIDYDKLEACFVTKNENLKEILFAYPSLSDECRWPHTAYCNRAVVYNYEYDTWAVVDLPNVTSSCNVGISSSPTYDTITATYDNIGGDFSDFEGGSAKHFMLSRAADATAGLTGAWVNGYDLSSGGRLPNVIDTETDAPVTLSREGIDLDELALEIKGRKYCRGLFPQMRILNPISSDSIGLRVGSAEYIGMAYQMSNTVTFNATSNYKVDLKVFGRFLAIQLFVTDFTDFELSGYDTDVGRISGR